MICLRMWYQEDTTCTTTENTVTHLHPCTAFPRRLRFHPVHSSFQSRSFLGTLNRLRRVAQIRCWSRKNHLWIGKGTVQRRIAVTTRYIKGKNFRAWNNFSGHQMLLLEVHKFICKSPLNFILFLTFFFKWKQIMFFYDHYARKWAPDKTCKKTHEVYASFNVNHTKILEFVQHKNLIMRLSLSKMRGHNHCCTLKSIMLKFS